MKHCVASWPGVELFKRDTGDPPEQLELEVGGWNYDTQSDDEAGRMAMYLNVSQLIIGLSSMQEYLRPRAIPDT